MSSPEGSAKDSLRAWPRTSPRISNALAALIALAVTLWFTYSRLAFTPVPWPDGSAFYLPGVDFFSQWPPRWRMHAQAAFVPSYDQANFNTMPGLPFLLGLGDKLGLSRLFGAVIFTRLVSLAALIGWAWTLWRWLSARTSLWIGSIIALAALLDPVNRWGTQVVRTETWIGLCWVWILCEASHETFQCDATSKAESKGLWRISLALALAAYFHFEAIILVPATALALFPDQFGLSTKERARIWWQRLLKIGIRTALLLSPWILYVLLNFGLFQDQMFTQFHRLEHGNSLISTPYLFFHSLFISHGSPVSWPKFFNVGKALFWALILWLTVLTFRLKTRRALAFSGMVAFLTSFYLWGTKPEVWFTTLCHLTLWPWLAFALIEQRRANPSHATSKIACLALAYGLLSLAATGVQQAQIAKDYSWENYQAWISCLEQSIGTGTKVWQPHIPDALVELSRRKPGVYDLTRALDFNTQMDLAKQLADRSDAILLSSYFNADASSPLYRGPERSQDRERLKNGIEVPFGPWMLTQPTSAWTMEVCQVGPFWADVAKKARLSR